jgi:hypothetical protein
MTAALGKLDVDTFNFGSSARRANQAAETSPLQHHLA